MKMLRVIEKALRVSYRRAWICGGGGGESHPASDQDPAALSPGAASRQVHSLAGRKACLPKSYLGLVSTHFTENRNGYQACFDDAFSAITGKSREDGGLIS